MGAFTYVQFNMNRAIDIPVKIVRDKDYINVFSQRQYHAPLVDGIGKARMDDDGCPNR
jgi:hypothetical protein